MAMYIKLHPMSVVYVDKSNSSNFTEKFFMKNSYFLDIKFPE